VGLPADAGRLAELPPSTVDRAFAKAAESGVADLDETQLAGARQALARHARDWRPANRAPPGTLSTLGPLLPRGGLSDTEQSTFAGLLDGDGSPLWDLARAAGIPAAKIDALQWQGRLAHLTLNNAPLITALQRQVRAPEDLVLKDFHRPETWQRLL